MTIADKIRSLSNDELVILLVHGVTPPDFYIPQCDEWCEYYEVGCFANCTDGRREEFMREWLEQEAD